MSGASDPAVRHAVDWLIACCRRWLGGPPPVASPPDGATLGRLSYLHQLDPLLHSLAENGRIDTAGLPAQLRRRWGETFYRNFIFNSELVELGGSLIASCRERDLPLVLFKGPITAIRGYGALELRIMGDLDLLCRERDLDAVVEAAYAAGFRPTEQTADYHLGLAHADLGAALELHFELYDQLDDRAALLEEVVTRPEWVDVDGVSLPAASAATAAILDLAHLAHHDYRVPLRALLDLAAVLHSGTSPPRPAVVVELAHRTGLAADLGRLLAFYERELDWPLPAGFADLVATAPPAEPLAAKIYGRLTRPDTQERRPLFGGPHAKASSAATGRYLLRRLFPPPRRLQALYQTSSAAAGLLHLPRHMVITLRRGVARWRSGGIGRPVSRRSGHGD